MKTIKLSMTTSKTITLKWKLVCDINPFNMFNKHAIWFYKFKCQILEIIFYSKLTWGNRCLKYRLDVLKYFFSPAGTWMWSGGQNQLV